jgi:putative pre-16S rRNA nuclease
MTSVKPRSLPNRLTISAKTLDLQLNACIIASARSQAQGVDRSSSVFAEPPSFAILNLDPSRNPKADTKVERTAGRLVALDLGDKRVGVAISDELQITASPLPFIERRSWKDLLRRVASVIETYDARGLVIGLPLSLDGNEGEAALTARRLAENFRRSLNVPVYLQDERLTTVAAEMNMRAEGIKTNDVEKRIDSESAAIILRDFMMAGSERP